MFGFNMLGDYNSQVLDIFGGVHVSLIVTLVTRLLIGIGWYQMFKRQGLKGWLAFVPVLGPYQAFRLVYDDFSLAFIFGASCFVAWVHELGVEHSIIVGFAIVNVILWWIMAAFSAMAFRLHAFFGFLYGLLPWAGALIFGWGIVGEYQGPWSPTPQEKQEETSKAGPSKRPKPKSRKKKR